MIQQLLRTNIKSAAASSSIPPTVEAAAAASSAARERVARQDQHTFFRLYHHFRIDGSSPTEHTSSLHLSSPTNPSSPNDKEFSELWERNQKNEGMKKVLWPAIRVFFHRDWNNSILLWPMDHIFRGLRIRIVVAIIMTIIFRIRRRSWRRTQIVNHVRVMIDRRDD